MRGDELHDEGVTDDKLMLMRAKLVWDMRMIVRELDHLYCIVVSKAKVEMLGCTAFLF